MKTSTKQKLDRLDHSLRELLTELDGYSDATLNRAPKENAWSVFQTMHHLILSERMSLKYIKKKLSFEPKLKKAGIGEKMRSALVNNYLRSPLKRKAPTYISGENLPTDSSFWDVVKTWKTDREALRLYLSELPDDLFDKEIYKHPFGGRLSLDAMLSFFQQHYERHLKQIRRTLRELDAVKLK
ncbi:MAG: DinB family protein [Bacteroidota bacterium]